MIYLDTIGIIDCLSRQAMSALLRWSMVKRHLTYLLIPHTDMILMFGQLEMVSGASPCLKHDSKNCEAVLMGDSRAQVGVSCVLAHNMHLQREAVTQRINTGW